MRAVVTSVMLLEAAAVVVVPLVVQLKATMYTYRASNTHIDPDFHESEGSCISTSVSVCTGLNSSPNDSVRAFRDGNVF